MKEEKDKMNKEKDQEIGDLQLKIDSMGRDYERVLNVCLSSSVFRPELYFPIKLYDFKLYI